MKKSMILSVVLLVILVPAVSLATSAFALDWKLIDDGDPAPRARYGMTYDSSREKVILFGGDIGSITMGTDTWEYDGSNWEKKMLPSHPPAPTCSSCVRGMTYDTHRNRIVLLLRVDWSYPNLETWEYDGHTWTKVITQTPAPDLGGTGVSTAYDKWRKRAIYFGRQNTWEYDGNNWIEVKTQNAPGGHNRMVFDSTRNRIVMFRKASPSLWEYDGTDWSPIITANSPPRRQAFGLTYNDKEDKVILYGGVITPPDGPLGAIQDTWEFDGQDWKQVSTADVPSERWDFEIVYDERRDKVVLFGGLKYERSVEGCEEFPGSPLSRTTYYDDTWEFDGVNWYETKTKSSPPARFYTGVAYNSDMDAVFVFGGENMRSSGQCPLNDIWLYDGKWQEIQLANPPLPIKNPGLTYDSNRKLIVAIGVTIEDPPCCQSSTYQATWEFDGTQWTRVNTPTSLPASFFTQATIYFDNRRNRVAAVYSNTDYEIEIWEYDGSDWTQRVTPHRPTLRKDFVASFDNVRGKLVLYGGKYRDTDPHMHDTWEYDGNDWVRIQTQNSPEASRYLLMTFDSYRRLTILHGGWTLSPDDPSTTWEYDGNDWKKLQVSVPPEIHGGTQMVFDEDRKKTILFGGIDNVSPVTGETWELGATIVEIDVKPGSDPNSINPRSKGKTLVAILSTEHFYAPEAVDTESLTFGRSGDEESLAYCSPTPGDVNGDGLEDLVCRFYTDIAGFQCGDEVGILKGQTMDEIPLEGSDSVRMVPSACKD